MYLAEWQAQADTLPSIATTNTMAPKQQQQQFIFSTARTSTIGASPVPLADLPRHIWHGNLASIFVRTVLWQHEQQTATTKLTIPICQAAFVVVFGEILIRHG